MSRTVNYREIGLRIKTLRMKNDVMQTELAKKLELSQTHMSNIESGKAGLTVENLVKLADEFDCTLDEIIFGEIKVSTDEQGKKAKDEFLNTCTIGEFLQALHMLKKVDKHTMK